MGDTSRRLTSDDFAQLHDLFQRFCEFELDQHDAWKLKTSHGYVYVDLSRKPSHENYWDISTDGPEAPATSTKP